MESAEAISNIKPQILKRESNSKKNNANGYFFIICVLFILIIGLCANNLSIYKYYMENKVKYIDTFKRVQDITDEKQKLNISKQQIDMDNSILKEKYNTISNQNREIIKQMQEIKKQNDELIKKNKELIDDNIALQNSIKKAAAVGIKPQSYTEFSGITSRGDLNRGKYIGEFVGTAYTPSFDECGNNLGITNSGKPIIPGISIAIDEKFWPFGTVFYIKGLGYAVAMDTGSKIKGKNRFDFAVFDKDFANTLGTRKWQVYLVKLGKGEVEDIKF
jgi:3D (Asp-Asp-Asp) domain-containing protein